MQSIRGKEISMVFQEPMTSLNPVYSCGEQVLETILQHNVPEGNYFKRQLKKSNYIKENKDKVISLFNKVRLKDPEKIYKSYPYQLSGGQRQRIMIAMAVSCNPRLLLADEPTTALDLSVQRSILNLISELQAETGMSILFISHDINVISEIAKRVIIIKNGEIVEQGDIPRIISNPEHPYTQGLMACSKSLKNKGMRLVTMEEFINPLYQNIPQVYLNTGTIQNIPVLTIKNLSLNYKRSTGLFGKSTTNRVLNNVNLDVYRNETIGLVGESGSGKTSLGRSVMKLIDYDRGDIIYNGINIKLFTGKKLKNYHRKVQIIFQDPYSSLNPRLTIGDIITEPMIVHHIFKNKSMRKKRVLELLRQVNLDESFYKRYAHQLSGGQRQRIGIARALAVEPELLILDESVSALDVSIQAQVLNLLNDLKKLYNLTFIFISHDLSIVNYMSDRIVEIKEGRVFESSRW
jgi:peptide/nickel transport system ATP-binding protein